MITVTGNLESLIGVGNGYTVFTLINFGNNVPRLSGTGVIVNPSVTTLAGTTFSVQLWGNDAITPTNTYYQVSFYDTANNLISSGTYQFNGSGSFDLSQTSPVVVTPTQPLGLASVAYSGSYNDLGNKPTIPAQSVASVAGKTGAVVLTEADISSLTTDLAATEKTANKGVANGYASLDSTTHIPVAQLPTSGIAASTVNGYAPGNASGNIAVNNGTVNTNLNADMVDGYQATSFQLVSGKGAASGYAPLDSTCKVPAANLPAVSTLSGTLAMTQIPSGGSSSTYLRGDGTWATPAGGSGTVTTTGSPASGNLAAFSGATSVTNGNLSGDVTTSGTLATTVVKVNGGSIPASAALVGTNSGSQFTAVTAGSGISISGGSITTVGQQPMPFAVFVPGTFTASQVLFYYKASVAFTVPSGAANSYITLQTAATGACTFTLLKNGTSFGTIAVSASGTTGTFTVSSTTSFSVGDVLTVTAPSSADATAAGAGLSLLGTR